MKPGVLWLDVTVNHARVGRGTKRVCELSSDNERAVEIVGVAQCDDAFVGAEVNRRSECSIRRERRESSRRLQRIRSARPGCMPASVCP